MTTETDCISHLLGACIERAETPSGAPLFGIGEFLTAIAVFAVAYTLSDERYKFRLAVSAVPLHTVFFVVTILTGMGLIVLPFWFEWSFPIPSFLNDQTIFEAVFATLVIGLIALWTFVAFISPPRFSSRNSLRFAQRVFHSIADGDEGELTAVAYELGRSARPIVQIARQHVKVRDLMAGGIKIEKTAAAQVAHDLVLLMGDKRLCRLVARKMPWVASAFFKEMDGYRGTVPIEQFAKNVAAELFSDTDSAIHHEHDGYRSGLIGYVKPVSSSLFGNADLIDSLSGGGGSPIDPLWLDTRAWSAESWRTYNKAVLLYLDARLRRHRSLDVTTAIYQIGSAYEHACLDLYRVNSMSEEAYGTSIEYRRLQEVVDFIDKALEVIDRYKVTTYKRLADLDGTYVRDKDLIDVLASIAKAIITQAASVSTSEFRSWNIQHNTIWATFLRDNENTYARNLFRLRLTRLLWAEIRSMERLPSYAGARILGACINVMGFRLDHQVYRPPGTRALKRAVNGWCRENFMDLFRLYPDVAKSCLVGNVTFDYKKQRLTKTYASSFGRPGQQEVLQLR